MSESSTRPGSRRPRGRGRAPDLGARGSSRKAPSRLPRSETSLAERPLRPGQKVTLTFRAMNLEGAGVAGAARQVVTVPFALPGEEAVVEITAAGRRQAQGKIVSLLRKSPEVVTPRCRHFGRCGGCQWQHLPYPAQLRQKTLLVKDYLKSTLQISPGLVRDALGADPWGYRNRIQAAFAVRRDRLVGGYYATDDRSIINVQECPIQYADNVRILHAARDSAAELGWPVYDVETGRGLVRGVIGQVGLASGEMMLVLCTTREVPDRMAFVRAVRDRLDRLVSVLLSVQPRHTPELLGRLHLLWGRLFIEDEVAGLRLRLYASPAIPPNPRALPLWLDAIVRAAELSPAETVVDVACEEGFVPLALAARAARVVGVAPDRDAMHRAWENARLNGVDNCIFYTRDPAGVLAKLRAKGDHADVVVVTSRGGAISPDVFAGAAAIGARRVVYAGHSTSLLATDLSTAASAGYQAVEIQPVDLLPQTSRVHCVARLVRNS